MKWIVPDVALCLGIALALTVQSVTFSGAQDVPEIRIADDGAAHEPDIQSHGDGSGQRIDIDGPRPIAVPVAPIDSDRLARGTTFDTGTPTALAAFLRDDALWLVFAADQPVDPRSLAQQGELGLGTALIAHARGGVALRFDNMGRRHPTIVRDGTAWTVTLPVEAPERLSELFAVTEPDHPDGSRLFVAADGASRPVAFIDPAAGDILVAMPVADPEQALGTGRRFVEFQLLPSVLGVVIRPVVEDIRLRAVDGGIAITSESGLHLS